MTKQIRFSFIPLNELDKFEQLVRSTNMNLVDCDIKLDIDSGKLYFLERQTGTIDVKDSIQFCAEQDENDDWDICAYID